MVRALLTVLSMATILCGTMACEEPNSLTGSITDSHDLSFDTVQLRLFTDQEAYELRYEKALESGDQDIVAKIVFDVPSGGVVIDDTIDLLANNGRIERITAKNDPFPAADRGEITFTAGAIDDGDGTTGSWTATFANGKTITGTFDTPLEHASFDG